MGEQKEALCTDIAAAYWIFPAQLSLLRHSRINAEQSGSLAKVLIGPGLKSH